MCSPASRARGLEHESASSGPRPFLPSVKRGSLLWYVVSFPHVSARYMTPFLMGGAAGPAGHPYSVPRRSGQDVVRNDDTQHRLRRRPVALRRGSAGGRQPLKAWG